MNGYLYRAYVSGGQCSDTSCSAFLLVNPTTAIITTLGNDSSCNTATNIPIDVEEFNGVAAISLTLVYDTNIVSFSTYQNPNPALAPGTLIVNSDSGHIVIAWSSPTIVASIETVWAGTLKSKEIQYWDYSDQDITLEKGAEMGRFKLGSTIVALFPQGSINFAENLQAGSETRLGELFASLK